MKEDSGEAVLNAACFRIGIVGAQLTHAFSARIERLGVTHKHVGLLAVVDAGLARSQRDIAARLHVAPSLVVSLVDQLIELDAVNRSRSSIDRRVQLVELTDRGRELLAAGARAAREVDAEFTARLSTSGRSALGALLLDLDVRDAEVDPAHERRSAASDSA